MGKVFTLMALALLAACAIWGWISLRKYAARKRLEEERAAAFMVEAVNALRKARSTGDKI